MTRPLPARTHAAVGRAVGSLSLPGLKAGISRGEIDESLKLFSHAAAVLPQTGARRFWPVACGTRIDIEALQADLDQLWAEAVHLYRQGEQTWATPEMTYIAEAQEQRFQTDPWEEHVIDYVYGKQKVRVCDVLDHLRVDLPKQTQADKNRVCKILQRLGYTCRLVKKAGLVMREYRRDE